MKAAEIRKKLDKNYPKTIFTGSELDAMAVSRLPSGSFVFDLLTGGGIPKNRITVFHGPKSSSKSTFAQRLVGMFQTLHPDLQALYVDFEGTFDWKWADSYIPDRDRCIVVKPDYAEVGIDIIKAYAEDAEDVGLVVVDSLGGIIPTAEADAAAADYTQIGLQVKLVNRMIRILLPRMSQAGKAGRELSVIAVNQVRANMSKAPGGYGSPYSQPCGKFLEHAASMDIRFYSGEYTNQQGIPVKVKHKFLVDKNKVSVPKRQGVLEYYIAAVGGYSIGEMDEEKVVITYAKRAGVIQRDGAKWIIPSTKKEPYTFGSMLEMMKTFREDAKLFAAVKKATLKACLANPFLSGDEEEEK